MKRAAAAIALLAISAAAHGNAGIGIVLDSRGNVFYTDLHQVWLIAPDGKRSVAVPNVHTHELAIDANDNLFGERIADGPVMTVARGRFREPRWINVNPQGTLYVIDGRDLVRVAPDGSARTVVANLAPESKLLGLHVLFGVWFDRAGNVYVADYAHRKVLRVASDSRSSVFAESTLPWGPTGGVFAPDGDLWLLEYSLTNQARVRRITARR